jgi:hypothetical protein
MTPCQRQARTIATVPASTVMIALMLTLMLAVMLPAARPAGAVNAPTGAPARADLAVPHPGRPVTAATPRGLARDDARLLASPGWREFAAEAGRDWRCELNPISGAPHRAWGAGIDAPTGPAASAADAEARAREFITAHAGLLAGDPSELVLAGVNSRAGRHVLVFQQTVSGVPVEGGRVDVRIAADGRISLFGSDAFPGIDISTSPRLSAFEAAARVRGAIGFDPAYGEERDIALRILPIEREGRMEYRLAWRAVHLLRNRPALWVTWLDAMTGETLWRYDDLRYETMSGAVDAGVQMVLPSDPHTNAPLADLFV